MFTRCSWCPGYRGRSAHEVMYKGTNAPTPPNMKLLKAPTIAIFLCNCALSSSPLSQSGTPVNTFVIFWLTPSPPPAADVICGQPLYSLYKLFQIYCSSSVWWTLLHTYHSISISYHNSFLIKSGAKWLFSKIQAALALELAMAISWVSGSFCNNTLNFRPELPNWT